jgi:hypothetical protein
LIESPLDLETGELFGDRFHVVPRDKEFPSLLVNLRPPNDPGGGMFDTSKGALGNGDVSLTLLDMFDWLPLDYIDLRYYETRIREFKAHPEYVGHRALVEVMYCKVLYDEGEISDDTINPAAPGPRG